ncbi:hypothetical protein ACFLXY_08745 [Chloroflexota bacterium]
MNSKKARCVLLFLIPAVIIFLLASCNGQSENWEYATYTLNLTNSDGIEDRSVFSFEYPKCFDVVEHYKRDERGITDIDFTKEGIGKFENQRFCRIAINDYSTNDPQYSNLLSVVENRVSLITSSTQVENCEIIDRATISLSEIEGEYFHISVQFQPPQLTNPRDQFFQEFWFEVNNYIWRIFFVYGPEYDEKATTEVAEVFSHLLETFQILE